MVLAALLLAAAAAPADREFQIRREVLALKDGVRLSATYFLPERKTRGERFPVLLELLPYRKDDSFYLRDYPVQTAMRQPPALKAVLAADAADNVYRDSVDFIDGAFHVDSCHLQVHHEAALPRSPDYALDEAYFRDRFERKRWFFTYVRHQQDGSFWRKSALQFDSSRLKVPAYLIGGLLDGYRDAIPRMLENASAPVVAEIGPWNHSWPNDGTPGPNHEWGRTAVAFWNRWLGTGAKPPASPPEKRFAVFVRDAHEPDARLETTPGHWRYEEWPLRRTVWRTLHPAPDGAVRDRRSAAGAPARPRGRAPRALHRATRGRASGRPRLSRGRSAPERRATRRPAAARAARAGPDPGERAAGAGEAVGGGHPPRVAVILDADHGGTRLRPLGRCEG